MAPLLEVRNLHKSFGPISVLRGIDLFLDPGEVLALVGDNGAGKTTLIKHIAGVYRADSGEILLNGALLDIHTPADARRLGIETVYQDLALADHLSVGANIFLGREPVRRWLGFLPAVDNRKIRTETEALLTRIESRIPPKAKTVSRLSGGQRQAVAIARTLYWQSKVVILDEPTAALAVMEREHVIALARRLAKENVGVIYIGHNLIEILEVADRIAVMFQGRIVFEAAAADTTQQELIKYMTGFSGAQGPAPNWGRNKHQEPMMLSKSKLLAATAIFAAASLPAHAADFSGEKIPVIVKATTSQYWATVFDGADAAAKELGVTISKLGASAETDVAGEVSIMENAIQSKPTAIVIAATNAQALAGPIADATEAGIPVIIVDSNANTDKYATFLATDNGVGGMKAADELASCVKLRTGKEVGTVAYMTALAGAQSLNDRDKGFVEEMKKYPDLKIVEHRIGNNDPARALSDAEDILTRHPDLTAVFADNELEGDGAGRAIQEKTLGAKVCAVAFDTSDQELAFVRNGNLDGLIVQNPYMMGYAGVWYAVAAAHGAVLPKYVDSGVHVVTKANIDNPQMVGLLDPKKYQVTPFVGG